MRNNQEEQKPETVYTASMLTVDSLSVQVSGYRREDVENFMVKIDHEGASEWEVEEDTDTERPATSYFVEAGRKLAEANPDVPLSRLSLLASRLVVAEVDPGVGDIQLGVNSSGQVVVSYSSKLFDTAYGAPLLSILRSCVHYDQLRLAVLETIADETQVKID